MTHEPRKLEVAIALPLTPPGAELLAGDLSVDTAGTSKDVSQLLELSEEKRFEALLRDFDEGRELKQVNIRRLLTQREINPESLTVRSALCEANADVARDKLRMFAQSQQKNTENVFIRDVADRIVSDVFTDHGRGRPFDAVDFDATMFLADPAKQSEGQEHAVEDALRLCILNVIYKHEQWQERASALESFTESLEAIIQALPRLNLKNIGLEDLKGSIQTMIAATNIDLRSKPNYESARPELAHYRTRCVEVVRRICKLEAAAKQ